MLAVSGCGGGTHCISARAGLIGVGGGAQSSRCAMYGVEVGGLLGGCHVVEFVVKLEGLIKMVRRICAWRTLRGAQHPMGYWVIDWDAF